MNIKKVKEIKKASLEKGEEDDLREQRDIYTNAEQNNKVRQRGIYELV